MADTELNIALRVIDEATEPIKTAITGIKGETDKLKDSSEKAGKSIQTQFKEASKELRSFRQAMFAATAVTALAIKSVSDLAEFNQEAKRTMDGFTISLKTLSATLGTLFQPAIQALTVAIDFFRQTIEAAIGGFVKLFAFVFEFISQLPEAFRNVFENVKAIFTGEDPIGIVEGFQKSFDRALEVANIAADQVLTTIETTRARIETGDTLKHELETIEVFGNKVKKINQEITDNIKAGWATVNGTIENFGAALAGAEELSRGFAKAAAVIAIGMAIMQTAQGITAALAGPPTGPPWPANLAMAALVAATGAVQIATISAQKFHSGGMIGSSLSPGEVPIIAQTGEAVLSRRGVASIGGESGVNRINQGGDFSSGGGMTVNVYYPKMSNKEEVSNLAEDLGFELQRQLRYARST